MGEGFFVIVWVSVMVHTVISVQYAIKDIAQNKLIKCRKRTSGATDADAIYVQNVQLTEIRSYASKIPLL